MGSNGRYSGLGKEWEGNGSLIVFEEWNGLSNHIVSAETIWSFKRRLVYG